MPFTFKLSKRLALMKASLAIAAAVLAACERILQVSGPSSSVVQVVVAPDSVTLDPYQTQQFLAYGRTQLGDSVTVSVAWSTSGGTVTAGGMYTADTTAGSYQVMATTQVTGSAPAATPASTTTVSGSSQVKNRGQLKHVIVTPTTATVLSGGTRQFAAYGTRANGDSVAVSVVYSATGGTISAPGLYTAGPNTGSYRVIASQSGGTLADTAAVTISTVAVASVSVSPTSASVPVGATVQLTATPKDSAGNSLTGRVITWSSSAPAVATVSNSGLVTGVVPGSATISATSETKIGTSAITVVAPPPPPPSGGVCTDTVAPAVTPALRTFYVDGTNGNDAANGTSPTAPWQTLAKANSTARAGDLFLLQGTFLNQVIHPSNSGTTSAQIVYRVWPGATAALDGGQYGEVVWLDGLSNIVVDGLELRNVAYAVTLNSGATHNWLRNLQIHDLASEAVQIVGGSDNRLENSNIQRCGDAATNSGDCIWIADNANRNVVVRNTISYGGHGAIDIGGDRTPLQPSYDNVVALNDVANPWASNLLLQGYARRAIVECNRLHSASTTGINYPRTGMYITADSNIVRYNELFGNTADGIEIAGYNFQGFVEHARGNWVYNNTFWGNGGAGIEMFQGDVAQVSDNVIENNILWGNNVASNATVARYQNGSYWDIWVDLYHANTVWPDGSLNGNVLRNNLAAKDAANIGQGWLYIVTPTTDRSYTLAQAQASLPNVAGNLQADPQFVNPGSFDFRLQATSPAIDAGLVIPGIPYLGTAPDLGAHEMR